jgi:hypothetical protein
MTAHELTALLALAKRPQIGCSRQEVIDAGIPAGSATYVLGNVDTGAGGLIGRGYVYATEPELPTGGRYWYKITPRGLAALKRVLAEAEAGVTVQHIVADGPVGGNRMKDFVALLTPPPVELLQRPDPGDVLPGEVLPELVPADHRPGAV